MGSRNDLRQQFGGAKEALNNRERKWMRMLLGASLKYPHQSGIQFFKQPKPFTFAKKKEKKKLSVYLLHFQSVLKLKKFL